MAPPGCGDASLTDDEACDDGNRSDGDGCLANCLGVEPGYSCNPAGQPCHAIALCGDGVVAPQEQCDDFGNVVGDGCSGHCKLEQGYQCSGQPSTCALTTCGDGVREGTEGCDDGNVLPFDGCSADCKAEPDCSAGACTSTCGDGLVLGEDCDDGNLNDGDGCSSACALEGGFVCSQQVPCDEVGGQCVQRVPVVYRDFDATHVDFGHGCPSVPGGIEKGIVQSLLGPERKPAFSPGAQCVASADSFAPWYTETDKSSTIVSELVLFDNGSGGYVNRYGANGEKWHNDGTVVVSNYYCGDGPGDCTTYCTITAGQECLYPCPGSSGQDVQCLGTQTGAGDYDGNPLFFPIDESPLALPGTRYEASIPAGNSYGYSAWVPEKSVIPGAGLHDFHFTTEVHYWFKFAADKSAKFDFTGDDDVWVFINGKLAVDLGGVHEPLNGSATIDAGSAGTYGLEDGKIYEMAVFHAERNVGGSSFRLTLAGFETARSDCSPVCGDGIVSAGEQCDDGLNDGGYGECDAGCVLGAYCGDGIVQADEDCDDGNRFDGDTCGSACRQIVVK